MKQTVAIVGSHPRTRNDFDWSREDCDIWVFNESVKTPENKGFAPEEKVAAVFQMHEPVIFTNPGNRNDAHHYDWLKEPHTFPIYMQEQYPDVPASVAYPLAEISARFGLRYFTSTPAYALALACHLGYSRIELFGVEMETNTEYTYQRDGVTLWLGVAAGLGIVLDVHSSIWDQPLYGYEGAVTLDVARFDERIAELAPQVQGLTNAYVATLVNVKNCADALECDGSKANEEALYQAVAAQVGAGEELGKLDGALQENRRYQQKAETMREQSGAFVFSRQEFESAAANLRERVAQAHTLFVAAGTRLGIAQENMTRAAKGSGKRAQIAATYRKVMQEYLQASNREAVYQGACDENFRYMAYLDKHIRAAGGAKSEAVMLEALQNA